MEVKIEKWSSFKALMAKLNLENLSFEKFQLEDKNGFYTLCVKRDLVFIYELDQSNEAEKTEYETDFKSGFIIANSADAA